MTYWFIHCFLFFCTLFFIILTFFYFDWFFAFIISFSFSFFFFLVLFISRGYLIFKTIYIFVNISVFIMFFALIFFYTSKSSYFFGSWPLCLHSLLRHLFFILMIKFILNIFKFFSTFLTTYILFNRSGIISAFKRFFSGSFDDSL